MSRLTTDSIPTVIKHLRRDRALKKVIERVGPYGLKRQTNRYQSLLRAIIAQQISSSAARSIWNRITLAAGTKRLTADIVHAIPDEVLRSAGVSPQKLKYVRDLTERVHRREIRLSSMHRLSDEEVIAELIQIKGIGVWTAQMFLIFSLGRPDVMPHGDLGIQSAIRRLYLLDELPDRETCETISAPWRPYRSVACWYLWRSGELLKSNGKP